VAPKLAVPVEDGGQPRGMGGLNRGSRGLRHR
jgi:hypothetical protein